MTSDGHPDVQLLHDPHVFARRAANLFTADPIGTNVQATVLARSLAGAAAPGALWIVVESAGVPVGLAVWTRDWPPYLAPMPDAAAAGIATALHRAGHDVPGTAGDAAATLAFARRWSQLSGCDARRDMAEGVHVLRELIPPSGVGGAPRAADPAEAVLVGDWLEGFDAEAHTAIAAPRDDELVRRRIADGTILLWTDDGAPVSLAGWHRPSAGVGRVGPVYTPPEHRRHGYAAAVTAAAAQTILDAGATHVMLFTDLANPTSNGVYARLGFRRVADASHWAFASPGTV
jgi:RimJ/RimL family protein N-acetyltransferase